MKQQKFKKLITTKRLNLKPIVPSFKLAKLIYDEIANNREHFKFMPFYAVKSVEEEYNFLVNGKAVFDNGKSLAYLLFDKKTNDFIGMANIHDISWGREHGEIGAWVCKKFSHQGYSTEAIKALEEYFFGMGFHKISVRANVKNKASCGLIKKLGYKKEGICRETFYNTFMNEWENHAVFSKLSSEYKK